MIRPHQHTQLDAETSEAEALRGPLIREGGLRAGRDRIVTSRALWKTGKVTVTGTGRQLT